MIVVLLFAWVLTILGLPGNWLMVVVTAIYAWLTPADSSAALGWKTIVALLILAALGELLELLAGALGTARAGGSRRGAVLALLGSLLGGFFGLLVGVPLPLIGSLVGAVLFAGLGALAGALVGESWTGRDLAASWRIAKRAFVGRLLGTLGKVTIGGLMVLVVIVALVL